MSDALSERRIVRVVAEAAAQRIMRRVVAELLRMKYTLSGDDSGLKTTWDEICVQMQTEESFSWDAYDETVRVIVGHHVAELPKHEQEAIWLQTDNGLAWDCDEADGPEVYPVSDDDIVSYLAHEYVYAEAGRWSNTRIRAFIDRGSIRD